MKKNLMMLAALSLSVSLPFAAHATTYKCMIDGQVSYSDLPCPDGKPGQITIRDDKPDAAAQKAAQSRNTEANKRADKAVTDARRRADADAKLRAQLALADKKAEEARLKKEAAEKKKNAERARKAQKAKTVKPAKPDGFVATDPYKQ